MNHERFAIKTRTITATTAFAVVGMLIVAAFRASEWQLTQLHFNGYALLSGIPFLVDVALLIYFLRRPAHTEERLWLLLYIGLACFYAIGDCMQRLSVAPQAALFWENFISPGAFIPAVSFLFALAYTNQSEKRYSGLAALLFIASGIYAFFANFTNILFVNETNVAALKAWGWDFNGAKALGPASYVALLWYMPLFLAAIARLVSFRRHTRNPLLRKQSIIFIFSLAIPPMTTAAFLLVLPALGQTNIVPLGIPIGCASLVLLAYGVARYELLTISPTLFSSTMLGLMQEAVVATDESFMVNYLNPNAEKLLGIKARSNARDDRTSLLKLLSREGVVTFKQAFSEGLGRNGSVDIEHLDIQLADKHSVPIHLTASSLRVGDRNAWIIVLTDITRELQVRSVIEHEVQVRTRELHEARAYLVSSINSLEQGFVLINGKGNVELLNRQAAKLFGTHEADFIGQAVDTVLQPKGWDVDLAKVVQQVLTSRRSRQLDIATAGGIFYEVYITPVLADQHVLGVTVIIQDVTERKILDRSKDEFFSIASHELRTPLTAIRGNMSMFQDYFPEALKDQGAKDLVTDTHNASVRLIEIVNDFLDSSRLEQGKMAFNFSLVNVASLVTIVQNDLKALIEQQHNSVIVNGLHKLPALWADEGRLRQILYNLLSNANKYSQNATITISGDVTDRYVRLHIADTGKGISPENQKLLFRKFQQAGESILTRDNTKGTGLGLYISKLLASNMHGDVALEHSEEGKGSTFMITIPVATKENLSQAKKVSVPAAAI